MSASGEAPMTRRRALLLALGALAATRSVASRAAAHDEAGMVQPPRPMPSLSVTLHDGRRADLRALLTGRNTALQFVLTGCSVSCPVLGAIFAQTQTLLTPGASPAPQLLSLSLDALGDTPASLAAWRQRFGAGPNWQAALPRVDQAALVDGLLDLGVNGALTRDQHTASVLLIDARARLVYRTTELPDSRFIAEALNRLAA